MSTAIDWNRVPCAPNALGESPLWHPQEQMLYWLDIAGKKLLRSNVYMGEVQVWQMPSEPGCMAPMTGGGLVIALREGIFVAQSWGGNLAHLATLPYDTATIRANDGKCDAAGRFWVGTVDESKTQKAAIYCIDARKTIPTVTCHVEQATTVNGIAWSPDNTVMYWSDTPRHTIYSAGFDLIRGVIGNPKIWVQCPSKPEGWKSGDGGYGGRPDGAAVDSQGNYYAAMYEGGRVCKWSPAGALLAQYALPALCPTMPCLGAEDGQTLYVTTASKGRDSSELLMYPDSGRVFSHRIESRGLPVNLFQRAIN